MPFPRYGSTASSNQETRNRELRRPEEKVVEEEEEEEEKTDLKGYLISLGRDILIAVIVMVIIIGSLWGYTGNWPPMVVIESNSMMHGDDSSLGVIDTGDLVLVKEISGRSDIKTYMEGKNTDYKTYGSYGDVIIFRKNGLDETPVIHRAVVWLEFNNSAHNVITVTQNNRPIDYFVGGFDVPSMGLRNESKKIFIPDYKPNGINLSIDLSQILLNFNRSGRTPHSGFITKGDNNDGIDQTSNLADTKGRPVEPVMPKWIVGKAEGELPWFGLIKLFIGGETGEPGKGAPPTSVRMLVLSIILIVVIPIILDLTFSYLGKRKKKRQEEEEGNGGPKQQEQAPPGQQYQFRPRHSERMRPKDQQYPRERIDRAEPSKKPEMEPGQPRNQISKDDLFKKIK